MLGRRGRAVAVTRSSLWHRLSRRWLHYAAQAYLSALWKRAAFCAGVPGCANASSPHCKFGQPLVAIPYPSNTA